MSSRSTPGWRFNVARLAELDMAFLGPRVVVVEFAVGVAGCLALGLASLLYAIRHGVALFAWPTLLGVELVAIGVNYLPLFLEAYRVRGDPARIAAAKAAIKADPAEARSYSRRQAWILVPGAVVLFALLDRAAITASTI